MQRPGPAGASTTWIAISATEGANQSAALIVTLLPDAVLDGFMIRHSRVTTDEASRSDPQNGSTKRINCAQEMILRVPRQHKLFLAADRSCFVLFSAL